MSFREKLAGALEANDSLLCVGLDPDPERIPAGSISSYLRDVIDATRDLVCAYKLNLAFYEQLGEAGYEALRAAPEVRAVFEQQVTRRRRQRRAVRGGQGTPGPQGRF